MLFLLIAAGGVFVSWLLVLFLYAFGELVDNSTEIRKLLEKGAKGKPVNEQKTAPQPQYAEVKKEDDHSTVDVVVCPSCKAENIKGQWYCSYCGASLKK